MTNSAKFMFTFGVITFFIVSIFAYKLNLGMNTGEATDTFMSWLFRLIAAIAASAISISLPGLLEIRFNKKKDGTMEIIQNNATKKEDPSTLADKEPTITASGAIAVFILVYLFNPIV
ncbi:hypothetical protein [Maribacter sp. MAR_2009_72]|uniref:hypothetical protein n=1 Tax=Maribacter sp. MAR_2009_72 TaxID=1250050 RepID=UPI00119B47BE|nr:hypothetical protein [Maribacter sp. MAR_2009_72]TVZ16097.1 hypothetical protein JM81_2350 [Maribacter sp. MAR_2009_72]